MIFRLGSIACVSGLLVACSGSSGPSPGDFDGGSSTSTEGTTPDGGTKDDGTAKLPPLPDGGPNPYEKKCRIACTAPEKAPCAAVDREECVKKCAGKLDDLTSECASCLLSASHWSGTYCAGCATCSFSSSGKTATCQENAGPEGGPSYCCKKEDESCSFSMPGPAEGSCRAVCLK